MRRDEFSGGHRLFCFREIARGVDRPDEDASDQGFARLGLGTVEEIAQAVLWPCSPGSGHVTCAALPVDGGCTVQ
ncbi:MULTISPECIES: hypothetical protein [unclassified Streptomyces]|uniref:hypothetical protein n=1 Tax=unclassified Streptomyces TaxID=2593676 RepID=UPI0036577BB3